MCATAETTENCCDKCETLTEKCDNLTETVAVLEAKILWFEEQIRLAKHRQFGASSEKSSDKQQDLVFNEAELEAAPEVPEPTLKTITYKRKKAKGLRAEQLKDLPVVTIEYFLSEEERVCPHCGKLRCLLHGFEEIRTELKIVPATVSVVKHIRYTYECDDCEKNEISAQIVTAPMPNPAFAGSLASPSAVAFIMSQKYVDCRYTGRNRPSPA